MNLVDEVRKTLKWKMSNSYCAKRLGIDESTYKKVKDSLKSFNEISPDTKEKQVRLEEDRQENTAILTYTGPKEIKTQEDLVRECNIDLDKWNITKIIHNAWGKEGNQSYQVKAWLDLKKETLPEILDKILKESTLAYSPVDPIYLNHKFSTPTLGVISLQDIHIGKEVLDKGGKSIEQSVKDCLENLVYKAYHSHNLEKIVFVLGGDLLNADTYLGTTSALTPLQNSMSAHDAYKSAFDLMFWAINFMKQFCSTLEVVYVPGNHDRLSSANLAYSLSKMIVSDDIIWNIDYAERKVITYGNSMICLEHGDFNTKRSFFVFATEFAKEWGNSKYRIAYTGHFHRESKVEYITADEINGFTLRILPSLSKTDRFHKEGKWTENKRGGVIELHSIDSGPSGQFSYFE